MNRQPFRVPMTIAALAAAVVAPGSLAGVAPRANDRFGWAIAG
jgi:hypothetical protein